MREISLTTKVSLCKIIVGQDILQKVGKILRQNNFSQRIVIITDSNVAKIYLPVLKHSFRTNGFKSETIILTPGEKAKSIENAKILYKKLIELEIHRDDAIVALGGGVIGDLAGFVAATYMRGINFVQCPTTLLSQVDASIGGKTAVNLEEAKNIIGVFYQPKFVFCDIASLITLPPSEIRNGLSEVIKYGIIKDKNLFLFLENRLNGIKTPKLTDFNDFKKILDVWENIVYSSARIKAKVVETDEKEISGERMILNFGHTIGHAIEVLNGYRNITHGQAVAIGMLAATKISLNMGLCKEIVVKRLEKILELSGLPTIIKNLEADDIIAKLILDKKVRDGRILFVLPKKIGCVAIKNDVPVKILRMVLKQLGAK